MADRKAVTSLVAPAAAAMKFFLGTKIAPLRPEAPFPVDALNARFRALLCRFNSFALAIL